jgi:tRNA 2-thiouridine synthesizing protein A
MADINPDVVIDTKGMNCPMPVLKTKKALDTLQSGQVLEVISTDQGSKSDIPILLNRLGHELLQTNEEGGIVEFYIRKK